MDMFDELVEIEVGIIVPYVKSLVELCLQVRLSVFHGTYFCYKKWLKRN